MRKQNKLILLTASYAVFAYILNMIVSNFQGAINARIVNGDSFDYALFKIVSSGDIQTVFFLIFALAFAAICVKK